ncbi:shikimate dehydrogenase [Kiritimatiellota bacterium B12222]|nr:shikimate dehydrogenase [Kiritimatiellota bacterium B12222]
MTSRPFSISALTRVFGVLGHPISHSLSPAMHNPTLQAMGLNAVYVAFDTPPEELMDTLATFAKRGFGGVNLTIPLKEVAFQNIARLSETAKLSGSVNTVVFHADGSMEGHSTDGYGLRHAVEEAFGKGFSGQKVLLLGCGGAGRAAALQAASDGATRILLANRTTSRAEALATELCHRFPAVDVTCASTWPPSIEETQSCDVVLQSTSLGMKDGDDTLLTTEHFLPSHCLLDMTYVKKETPLMKVAIVAGAQAVNGLGMLLHQGVRSLEIWTGQTVPVEVMRTALRNHVYGDEN